MKHNMIYVLCMLLATFAFALPFARGSRGINLDISKKPLAPCVTGMGKKDATWVRRQYHLDSAAYGQALVYSATSAMEVNEIAVFKRANKTKRETLQKPCQEHIGRQLESSQGYTPKQSALLEETAIHEGGYHVVVLIHPQQSRLRRLLEKAW